VPLYLLTWKLGWINTYQGLIFPLIIMSSGIFFLRQNIMSIPDELIDAARWMALQNGGFFSASSCL